MQTVLHPILEDFDLNLREEVETEREAVDEATGRVDELRRELDRLEDVLERRREAAKETDVLERAGVEPQEVDVAPVEEVVEAKRQELKDAERALAEAKTALREKMDALRSDLTEQVRERRDKAENRVAEGLTEAVRGNLVLRALNMLVQHADFDAGVSYSRELLPDGLQGYNSMSVQAQVANSLTERVQRKTDLGGLGIDGLQDFRGTLAREARQATPLNIE